ncbi:MAG: o-succinylbenzoate synthase [Acidimicrobiales bacterium]
MTALPPLEPLPPVSVEEVAVLRVHLPLAVPLRSAAGSRQDRAVLLVRVRTADAEGWAECAVEVHPTYGPEFVAAAEVVLRDELVPRLLTGPGDAIALGQVLAGVRGHEMARAAIELAVLDAQLRTSERPLADWLGATHSTVAPGAALGLHHGDPDALLAEANAALAAGAARLRVKIAPGSAAEPLAALRQHVGPDVVLQADANGSFRADHAPDHRELLALDEIGLACLEQPLHPDDLVGHARLAEALATPICLDEPITSLGAVETVAALGACSVVCLKPARVSGWIAARAVHDRCVELGLGLWVGGMLETGLGRAANLAAAALPGMTLPPDLDPRGRFDPDLADPRLPHDGLVAVPDIPGTGATPQLEGLHVETVGAWRP